MEEGMEQFYDRPVKELLEEWGEKIEELKAVLLTGRAVDKTEGTAEAPPEAPAEASAEAADKAAAAGSPEDAAESKGEGDGEAKANSAVCVTSSESNAEKSADGLRIFTRAELPEDERLLRFLLTFFQAESPVSAAANAVRDAFAVRKRRAAILAEVEQCDVTEEERIVQEYFKLEIWDRVRPGRPPLVVMRIGYCDPKELMNNLEHERVVKAILLQQMRLCRVLEQRQKETGLFTLSLLTVDCENTAITSIYDDRFIQAAKEAAFLSQVMQPSLSCKNCIVNTGWVWRMLFSIVCTFLPARAQAKVRMCSSSDTRAQDPAECPYLRRLGITKADLPQFLGGSVEVPESSPLFVRIPEPEQAPQAEGGGGWFG